MAIEAPAPKVASGQEVQKCGYEAAAPVPQRLIMLSRECALNRPRYSGEVFAGSGKKWVQQHTATVPAQITVQRFKVNYVSTQTN